MAGLYFVMLQNDNKLYSVFILHLEFPLTSIELLRKIRENSLKSRWVIRFLSVERASSRLYFFCPHSLHPSPNSAYTHTPCYLPSMKLQKLVEKIQKYFIISKAASLQQLMCKKWIHQLESQRTPWVTDIYKLGYHLLRILFPSL